MLRWFRAFLPREERFFDLFARHSVTVVKGAEALQDMLRGGDETPVYCQRVNQFENEADGITREVLTAVRRTFITPFDRVDIKNLITSMDDAIDQMQQTAKAVILFEVRIFEPPMREIGTLLVECANLVDGVVHRGDEVLDVDPIERRDEGAAHRGQHLAGNAIGLVFELVDALTIDRRFVAAAQHVLQGFRPLHHRHGMAGEQVEKPLLPRQKGPKPTQHDCVQFDGKTRRTAPCHGTVINHFPPKRTMALVLRPRHPPLCKRLREFRN